MILRLGFDLSACANLTIRKNGALIGPIGYNIVANSDGARLMPKRIKPRARRDSLCSIRSCVGITAVQYSCQLTRNTFPRY